MSTDPLGEALGRGEAASPPEAPVPGPVPDPAAAGGAQAGGQPAQAPSAAPGATAGYQAPSAYEPQQPDPAWPQPEAERSIFERRPEILVGAAAAGGFLAAQVLGRIRGR